MSLTDKLATFGQVAMTEASASFSGLNLNPSQVMDAPAGFDYEAISDLGRYSHLRIQWWFLEAGLRQVVGSRLLVDFALTYDDYQDSQPYLADATGQKLGFRLVMNWVF